MSFAKIWRAPVSDKGLLGGLRRVAGAWQRLGGGGMMGGMSSASFSFNNEEAIIAGLFGGGRLPLRHEFCVDVGAGDAVTMSNTRFLLAGGWKGLLVEYDPEAFAKLADVYRRTPGAMAARCKATPESIGPLLLAYGVPREFDFLSLDIDGYDHWVLEAILKGYRPTLVCTEINEMFPPPVRFVVKYDAGHSWPGNHFFGHSIAAVADLCGRHGYGIVRVEYNNAFLAPLERCGSGVEVLTAERAYREGYVERADRLKRFPWNAEVEGVLGMKAEEVVGFAERLFADYKGRFECWAG